MAGLTPDPTSPRPDPARPDPALRRLGRKRTLARFALLFERLWPALWPALGVAGVYLVLALFDLPALLPPWPRFGLFLLVLAAVGTLLWRGVRGLRFPDPARGDRRLEQASGLRHRPLAALADRPAAAGPEAEALWRVHVARMNAQVTRLRVGVPRPGLAALDRRALRLGLVVALAAGFMVAGSDTDRRLLAAVWPTPPQAPLPPAPQLQAWVTPPAYTGLAPVFLKASVPDVQVPAGSRLTVNLTGEATEPGLVLGGEAAPFRALDKQSWQAELDVTRGGKLVVQRRGVIVAGWDVALIADRPPTAEFPEPPGAATAGGRPTAQTRLPWRAEDDYGVAALAAELRLQARPDAAPLSLNVPLPGGSPKAPRGVLAQDLTAHPWAGLPVTARLVAKDAPGQVGTGPEARFTLPERAFQHPVAQALIEIRKGLSLDPGARRPAGEAVNALSQKPQDFDQSTAIHLNLRGIASLLRRGRGAAVEEAQARMWDLALALEEGAAERTAKALEAARQELRDAMDQLRRDEEALRRGDERDLDRNGPEAAERRAELERKQAELDQKRAELDQKMRELQEAIQRHLQALAEQTRREGTELPYDPTAPQLNQRDLNRMMEQMREAARQGRDQEARDKMADLERLLDQLQAGRPESGKSQNAEKRQRGRQQMGALQDMVKREGTMLDRSQSRAGTQADPRRPQPPAAGDPAQREADARAQRALRRALGELMQRFGDLTGQVPQALGEADQAMREAGQALGENRDAAAGAAQQRAIEALQRGGREMAQQMARQFGRGQPGQGEEGEGEEGEMAAEGFGTREGQDRNGQDRAGGSPRPGEPPGQSRRRAGRDPLGRPLQQGVPGGEEGDDVRVPDEMEQARTRAIQEELRRRGAERTRPQPELDYIDRLLRPF